MPDNNILASGGLYPDRKYAMELAHDIAQRSGYRTRVRPVNPQLWEIVWADMAFAAAVSATQEER